MDSPKDDDTKKTSSSEELHGKSWEIEILISGGVFFSMYQLAHYLGTVSKKLNDISVVPSAFPFVVIGIGFLSIYFVIHLAVRAFWLSHVLLQKIYPQGINTGNIKLAEPFQSSTNRFDLDKRIAFLDRLSGLIFSWGVTFAIILVGVTLGSSIWIVPRTLVFQYLPGLVMQTWWMIIMAILQISFLIFFIDTFFYGILRRSKVLSKLYLPIYLFWNTLTLAMLWRPSLQLIFSNVKSKWRASVLVLLVTLIISAFGGDELEYLDTFDSRKNKVDEVIVDETKYLDKRTEETIAGSFIQSDVITDNYLKVYVNYTLYDDRKVDSLNSAKHFSRIIKLSINDSTYLSRTWIGLNRVNGQKGIQTVVDISHLEKKLHILKIERTNEKNALVIPFWKQ